MSRLPDPVVIPDALVLATMGELKTFRDSHDRADETGRRAAARIGRVIARLEICRNAAPHMRPLRSRPGFLAGSEHTGGAR